MANVLVIVAHPDDEVLGCGASVAKLANGGNRVECLILGEGITSRYPAGKRVPKAQLIRLKRSAQRSARILGFAQLYFGDLPDNRFDAVERLAIVKEVEHHIDMIRPQTIYTHYEQDLNIDHQITFKAVMTAVRPKPCSFVTKVLSFEVPSATDYAAYSKKNIFCPNYFEDIDKYIEIKTRAMGCYKSELCRYPHPRSLEGIRNLAKFRGNQVGLEYAEAFFVVREINRR